MTYYIEMSSGRPVNDREFATIEDAFAFARAPGWVGAGPTEITVTGPASYSYRGDRFQIVEGRNPKILRAETDATRDNPRSALDRNGRFRGSRWLSREMDRDDSDF